MKANSKTLVQCLSLALALPALYLTSLPATGQSLPKALFGKVDQRKMQHWADSVYQSLNQEERLAQLIMPIIYPSSESNRIASEERRIRQSKWGGILYQKGMLADQVRMNRQLQRASKTPMLIALDGEWGLYMRLKDAPRYPRNLGLGLNEEDLVVYSYGREIARQCRLVGIHINFAPTVDVNINPRNPVIGSRSFGGDPKNVAKMSNAYAQGLEDGGVLSVAKHFPGHGDTSEDSHKTLPLVSASRKRLDEVELAPFRSYFAEGFGGVMTAHLRIPALDASGVPSSLSRKIVTDLLQRDLRFGGLIFTDGLEMKGAHAGARGDVGVAALRAGNDILLGPSNAEAQLRTLVTAYNNKDLDAEEIKRKVMKVLYYKYRLIVSQADQSTTPERIKEAVWSKEAKQNLALVWHKSLYYLHKDATSTAKLAKGGYKRIAVVQYGSNPVSSILRPRNTATGGTIDYIGWDAIESKAANYDYILVNSFSTSIPSDRLLRLAQQCPTALVYYTTPFKVSKANWMNKLSSVILTMEGAAEAQEAVLALLSREELEYQGASSTPSSSINQHDSNDDPTANMTPQEQVTPTVSTYKSWGPRYLNRERLVKGIDAIVNEGLRKGAFPSCQVLVMQYGQEILYKAYGSMEGTPSKPVSTTTVYDLASISKALATTPAIMMLVADKRLNLNERVATYLPELRGTYAGGISLRNLLLHQSGLAPGLPFAKHLIETATDEEGKPYLSRKTDKGYTLSFDTGRYVRHDFRTEMLRMIGESSPRRQGQYVYSDLNFILLGLIAERVCQKPLDDFLYERLWQPMGAKLYYTPLAQGLTLATIAPTQRYDKIREAKIHGTVDDESAACLGGVAGNAGVFGTARELGKMAQLILDKGKWNGKQYIPEAIVKEFLSARGIGGVRTLGFIRPQWGKGSNQAAESASTQAVGHYGFTGTAVWIDPKDGLVFVFLSNRTYPSRDNTQISRDKYRPRLHQAVYDALN